MTVTLSLDCTNGHLTASLLSDKCVLSYIQEDHFKEAAEYIAIWVQNALTKHNLEATDINKYISVIGPGGFSGVRTGTSFISAMAHVTQKEIISLSSLEALALSFDNYKDEIIISCLNAKRNAVYLAGYVIDDNQLSPFYKERLVNLDVLEEVIHNEFSHVGRILLAGHGIDFIKPYIKSDIVTQEKYTSDARFFSLNHHFLKVHRSHAPLYLRAPDATLPKKSFTIKHPSSS